MSMNAIHAWIPLVARIAIAAIFVLAGVNKITGFEGTVSQIEAVGLPLPLIVTILTIIVEVGGGIALAVGYHARWAALALAAFTVLTIIFFHANWSDPVQMIMALKNVSMIGGLLLVYSFGPGPKSLCDDGGCGCCAAAPAVQ